MLFKVNNHIFLLIISVFNILPLPDPQTNRQHVYLTPCCVRVCTRIITAYY